jgi:membrane protein required for colicin V production
MNALDIIFGVVLLLFIFIGIWKGFFREVLGFTGIIAGIIFGVLGFGPFSKALSKLVSGIPPFIWIFISFILIFIFVYILFRLLAGLLSRLSQVFLLGWLNRLLGGIIGGLKGASIISLLLLVIGFLPFQKVLHDVREDSSLYEPLQRFIPSTYNFFSGFSFRSKDFEKKITDTLEDIQGKLSEEIIRYFFYGKQESSHAK